jgi:hypothetical protein
MWLAALLIALPDAASANACFRDHPAYATTEAPPRAQLPQQAPASPQAPASQPALASQASTVASRERTRRLELSFSSAEKFYNQSVYDPTGFITRRAIPVSTLRPTGEWLFAQQRASLFLALDLPLEPRVELREDELIQTYVSPSVLSGLRLALFSLDVLEETKLEMQLEGSLGWLLAPKEVNRLFPSAGWRLHVRDVNGFTLFVGLAFEFRLNSLALIYGVGHRF